MELHIGVVGDFEEQAQSIVRHDDFEIGVFRIADELFAYENQCAHQGGPACEGKLIPRVVAIVGEDRVVSGDDFVDGQMHFVCPWHGWEYDMRTGRHAADARIGLRKFEVVRKGDDVYIIVP